MYTTQILAGVTLETPSLQHGTDPSCKHQTTAAHDDHAAKCVCCTLQPELMSADWRGGNKLTAAWSKSGATEKADAVVHLENRLQLWPVLHDNIVV